MVVVVVEAEVAVEAVSIGAEVEVVEEEVVEGDLEEEEGTKIKDRLNTLLNWAILHTLVRKILCANAQMRKCRISMRLSTLKTSNK